MRPMLVNLLFMLMFSTSALADCSAQNDNGSMKCSCQSSNCSTGTQCYCSDSFGANAPTCECRRGSGHLYTPVPDIIRPRKVILSSRGNI